MGPFGGDEAFCYEIRGSLEASYLGANDPRGGSGFRGDAGRWERARRPIASAVDRDGTFLDVGCANGLLMESLVAWCGEDGRNVEPYGLDLIPSLADLARERLSRWKNRIFTGNVLGWSLPSASTSCARSSYTSRATAVGNWWRGCSTGISSPADA